MGITTLWAVLSRTTPNSYACKFGLLDACRLIDQRALWRCSSPCLYPPSPVTETRCWDEPGFADFESSVWKMEWQLARYLATTDRQDTITGTQELTEAEMKAAIANNYWELSKDHLTGRSCYLEGGHTSMHAHIDTGTRQLTRQPPVSCPSDHLTPKV